MSTESSGRPSARAAGHIARSDRASGDTAAAEVHQSLPEGGGRTSHVESLAVTRQHDLDQRRFASLTSRRLGLVECTLLALVALGVVVTAVMAIVNP